MITIFKLAVLFLAICVTGVAFVFIEYIEKRKWDVGYMQMVAALYRVTAFGFVVWLVYEWFVYMVGL